MSTPAGTSTWYVFSAITRPSPLQVGHGVTMTWPRPPHFGHALAVTIWPSMLWRTRCTWPRPLHSEQVTGCVPCAGAGAAAVVASQRGAHVDRDRRAEHRLGEFDVGDDLEVLAARRAGRASPTSAAERVATPAAEERVEQIAEPASAEHVAEVRAAGRRSDAGLAEPVVARPGVGVD